MQLTTLGRYAPYAAAGGACSGYLLQGGGTALLLDGGPGTLSRLQERICPSSLGAVIVSHLHEDHMADLYGLQFPIRDAIRSGRRTDPLPVYAPPEPRESHRWLEPVIPGVIDLRPMPPAEGLQVGGLALRFCRTDHPYPCYAVRITDGRRTLVYTGDTGTGIDLAPFAAGADLLVTEATYTEATGDGRAALGHMTAAEAAGLAVRSGVGRLLLSHLSPGADLQLLLAEARAIFAASDLAMEMETCPV